MHQPPRRAATSQGLSRASEDSATCRHLCDSQVRSAERRSQTRLPLDAPPWAVQITDTLRCVIVTAGAIGKRLRGVPRFGELGQFLPELRHLV